MSWSAQPHFELPPGTWWMQRLNPHKNSYLSFLIASHWLLEILSLYFSLSMVVNKVKESFLLHTEKRTCFIHFDSIYGHFDFHVLDLGSCFYLYCHRKAYYLHYHPDHLPRSVYSYVMLCCYYMGFAFTSFHHRPALTQLLANYVAHYSWLLSRALSVWRGQTLTRWHFRSGLPLVAAVAVQTMWWWNLSSI